MPAFTNREWTEIGDFVRSELARREGARRDLEKDWEEIDRQIRMEPVARKIESGEKPDWFPDLELPLQGNSLEVIGADARRLKFPRGPEWFRVSGALSQKYVERWLDRRTRFPLFMEEDPREMILDQETANVLAKAAIDYFHNLYDFRGQIGLFDAEMIKYGSAVARVDEVQLAGFSYDFRSDKEISGPGVIALPIKNTYLDDSPSNFMLEGTRPNPGIIRKYSQKFNKLKAAAKKGGAAKGWIMSQVKKLDMKTNDDDVKLAEFEGDLIVPMNTRTLFLPNVRVVVACNSAVPRPVRFKELKRPTFVVGYYQRDDVKKPYGRSPLMAGRPLQVAAVDAFNDLLAGARMNADPPVSYDANDQHFSGGRGPDLYPGAQWASDSPNSVQPIHIPNLNDLKDTYLALLKQYEDTTGVNDPRRGAAARSHTTATSAVQEETRGLSRTDDFVADTEKGPITSMLYMEWQIIKETLKQTPMPVNMGGMEGWVNIASEDLPDLVSFIVEGSAGIANERERAGMFAAAATAAVQMFQVAQQAGKPFDLALSEITEELFKNAGQHNTSRFVGESEGVPGEITEPPGVGGSGGGSSPPGIASLPAQQRPG